ncbi:MAG: hypothetical protein V3U24_10975 [Candidatus Neomarinimicrobiota bacterium]
MQSRATDYFFGYNKVRLDLHVSPLEEVTFLANVNYQLFHGQEEWNLFDFLPSHVTDQLMNIGLVEFPFSLQDTLYLDNAYLRLSAKAFDVTVGKQQLSLGTGYAWNPLDIFNRKQLLDPTYEQTGVNSIRLEIPVAERLLVDLILSPGHEWNSSDRLMRGKIGLGRFDIITTAGIYDWSLTKFDSSTFQPARANEKRRMIGGAAVGELFKWGVWGEGGWISVESDEEFLEFLVGADHTFDFSTYLLLEYYHNGNGFLNRENLRLEDYLSYFSGEAHSLMQDYVFLFVNHPVTDLLTLGMFGIANLNDESAVINPQLEYSLFEDVVLSLLLSTSRGHDDSEFGVQDWGVRLRVRAYF